MVKFKKSNDICFSSTDQGSWYKRVENNGWRLVSDRLIHHIMNDPVTWETSKKEYKFDHSMVSIDTS